MAKQQNNFKKGTFVFVGKATITKGLEKTELNDTWNKYSVSLNIKNDTFSQFVTLEYLQRKNETKISLYNKEGQVFDVYKEDVAKEEVTERLMPYKRLTVDTTTDFAKRDGYINVHGTKIEGYKKLEYKIHALERKDKLSDIDKQKLVDYKEQLKEQAPNYVEYAHVAGIMDNIEDIVNKANENNLYLKVTGTTKYRHYKTKNDDDKLKIEYIPQAIEYVPIETEDGEDNKQLVLKANMFFNPMRIDDSIAGQLIFNGWLGDTVSKENVLYNQTFIYKYDATNEKAVKLKDLLKTHLLKDKDDNHIYCVSAELNVCSGAEVRYMTMEELSEDMRLMVEGGLVKLEDLTIFGENIDELQIRNFGKDFKVGGQTICSLEELERLLPKDVSNVKEKDVKEKDTAEKTANELDVNDLFDNVVK